MIWAAVGAALVMHAALLGTVQAFGVSMVGEGFVAAVTPTHHDDDVELANAPELKTTCSGDVLLATGARGAMCLAPWGSPDIEGCGSDAVMTMWMELSACLDNDHGNPPAPIALLDPKKPQKLTPIDPERLLDEAMQEELKEKPPQPIPQPKPQNMPPPPPPAPARPAQVVETVKPNTEQEPENARFLSENNVKVDKQTVARGAVKEPMVAKPKDADLAPKDKPKEASVQEIKDADKGKNEKAPDNPGVLAMRPPGTQVPSDAPQEARTKGITNGEKGPIVADGFVPRHGDSAIEQAKRDPGEEARGQSGAGGGVPQVPNLSPSKEALERALGGGSVDHLDDVDSGDETALSSKRWVYASFFNRLKRQVAQNWDPSTVYRRTDPTGTVYGGKTRVTEVRVSLSGTGVLQKIVVTNPSGVTDLDDEAVRAFHASAPFPNPPEGLVQKDGLITFAFSFYFEIGQPRSTWKVLRSQ